jgi:hypothetical protein
VPDGARRRRRDLGDPDVERLGDNGGGGRNGERGDGSNECHDHGGLHDDRTGHSRGTLGEGRRFSSVKLGEG